MSCAQVEKYEVKYISLGAMQEQEHRELDATEVAEDGTLVIEDFPGAGDKAMRLEARIVYSGGVASPWISSKEPVSGVANYLAIPSTITVRYVNILNGKGGLFTRYLDSIVILVPARSL